MTDIQIILRHLIDYGQVRCDRIKYMHGFRTRISELKNKYGFDLIKEKGFGIKSNGHKYSCVIHVLKPEEKQKAIDLLKSTGYEKK